MNNTQPSILIFMADQQRGCSVLPDDQYKAITPNFDAFRGTATTFTKAYTASPHCCPSGASFMTGSIPTEYGVWNSVAATSALSRGLRSNAVLWSVDLKELAALSCERRNVFPSSATISPPKTVATD